MTTGPDTAPSTRTTPLPDTPAPAVEEWLTLRQAAALAGVSVSAVRKWLASGLRSRLVEGPNGKQREVVRAEVLARVQRRQEQAAPAAAPQPAPVPEGYALVPVSLVERIGYLLDAAAKYAEAGERAGRAEATAEQYHRSIEGYRERVAALEEQLAAARRRWWRKA